MYKSINSWIEYLHPKLGYPVIARIEDEEKIKLQGYIIVKKVVNGEEIKLKQDFLRMQDIITKLRLQIKQERDKT